MRKPRFWDGTAAENSSDSEAREGLVGNVLEASDEPEAARGDVHKVSSNGGPGGKLQPRSVVVKPTTHRVSYMHALAGARTFKPRFNAATKKTGEDGWYAERKKWS